MYTRSNCLEKGEVVRVTKKDTARTEMRAEVLDPKWKSGLIKVAINASRGRL